MGPTFESETSSKSYVIEQCPKVLFEIIDAEYWKSANPNARLTEANGRPTHSFGVKVGLKVLEHDNPKFIGWDKYINLWLGLNSNVWLMKNITDQIGLDGVMKYFDREHPDYVGDSARPSFDGMDEDTLWENVANFYVTGVMQTADGELDSQETGLVGNAFYASIGKPEKISKGKRQGEDGTGRITPLKASAVQTVGVPGGMV